MSMSRREIRLLVATALVVLSAMTYVVVKGQLTRLRDARQEEVTWQLQVLRNVRELSKRTDLIRDLATIRELLPRHPVGKDIKSELSQQIQKMANLAGLELTGLTPETEVALENIDLHQLSIRCAWEGSPQALVSFLVRLQELGPVMDVGDLKIKTTQNRPGELLTGTFTVDCAFSRFSVESTPLTPSPTGPTAPAVGANESVTSGNAL